MMRKKIVSSLTLLITLIFLSAPLVLANEDFSLKFLPEYGTRILMNGEYLTADVMPQLEKSDDYHSILVPLQPILKQAGYTITKGKGADEITLQNGDLLSLNYNDGTATRAGKKVGTFRLKRSEDQNTTLVSPEFFALTDTITAKWDLATQTVIVSVKQPSVVTFYDLGQNTMKTSLGQDLTYTMNGGISVPDSNDNPVVVLLHGSHDVDRSADSRYDLGFSYLMKNLAEQGYLAISINVNWQYTLDEGEPLGLERIQSIVTSHLEELQRANRGESDLFGVDLAGKCDFSQVVLVGHSRSGGAIFDLAQLLPEKLKDLAIAGLLSIAPTDVAEDDMKVADFPTSVIVPELDGDVADLDGFAAFDFIRTVENRKQDAQLVYLYGANHNAFNPAILTQDLGQIWHTGEKKTISGDAQRNFTKQYVSAFVEAVTSSRTITSIGDSLSGALFDQTVMISNYIPGGISLYLAPGESVTGENAKITPQVQSHIVENNTAGLFRHPGGGNNDRDLDLLHISWETSDAMVSFSTKNVDCTGMDTLNLYLAQDSTSALNQQKNQSFTIELVDSKGTLYPFLLGDTTPALVHQPGEAIRDDTVFSLLTPMGMVSVPLDRFGEIKDIAEVRLKFTENTSGALMLQAISLAPQSLLAGDSADNQTVESGGGNSEQSAPSMMISMLILILIPPTIIIIGVAIFLHKRKNRKD